MSSGRVVQGMFHGVVPHVAQAMRGRSVQCKPATHAACRQMHPANAFQLPAHASTFSRGGGQPLPPDVRQKMESFFGTSFADVRIHVGPQASAIGALAFTQGTDIHFAPGQYNPVTLQGQQILGHELAHVMQQRTGRVRNPFGSGVAVVQDNSLEAEADRMGQRAAAHGAAQPMQRKAVAGAHVPQPAARANALVQRKAAPVHVSPPIQTGQQGSYRIAANSEGHAVGSVMVHARDRASIEVTDLGVDPEHRKQGVGDVLMASALRAGIQLGASKVILASQDNGSGRLTAWYKKMGFTQIGRNEQGLARLEAPISRAMACVAQGRFGRR